jgi:uncharacterized phage-associated protein
VEFAGSGTRTMHDARAIANFLLDYAESEGKKLTIMSLLKIIYFAHAWHLAKFGEPLIRNPFEAWHNGPVVRAVYDCFRDYGPKVIDGRATKFNPLNEAYEPVGYRLNQKQAAILRNVFGAYGHINAFRLSDMTHEVGSPWDLVWNAPRDTVNLGMRISNDSIRLDFLSSRSHFPLQ